MARAVDAQAVERDAQLAALADVARERAEAALRQLREAVEAPGSNEADILTAQLAALIVKNTHAASRIDARRDAAAAADWPELRECSRWLAVLDDLAALGHGSGLVLRDASRCVH